MAIRLASAKTKDAVQNWEEGRPIKVTSDKSKQNQPGTVSEEEHVTYVFKINTNKYGVCMTTRLFYGKMTRKFWIVKIKLRAVNIFMRKGMGHTAVSAT